MIILLYGKDEYRSRERLHTLRDAFAKKFDVAGHNTIRLDGETLTPEILQRHLRMQGFFASKRCIIIDRLCSGGRAETQTLLAESVESLVADSDCIVLLWEPITSAKQIPKKSAAAKDLWSILVSNAKLEEFKTLEGAALRTWVLRYAKANSGSIAEAAADKLIAMAGPELWGIVSELEKLIHYRQGEVVGLADVEAIVVAPLNDDMFRLTDAIGVRDRKRALMALEEQLDSGVAPLAMLGMIAWHIKTLLSVKSLLDAGTANPRTIAAQLGIHPFVVQKSVTQAALFSISDLTWIFSELLNIDRSLKSSRVDARTAFTLLIMKATKPVSR